MSDGGAAGSTYRQTSRSAPAPLLVRYAGLPWSNLLAWAALAGLLGWGVSMQPAGDVSRSAFYAGVLLLMLLLVRVPIVTIRARIEGGHLVVSGRRFPGPEVMWSCPVDEAQSFEVETFIAGPKSKTRYRRIALRTTDGKLHGLTEAAYPTGAWPHPGVAARLNAWLALSAGHDA